MRFCSRFIENDEDEWLGENGGRFDNDALEFVNHSRRVLNIDDKRLATRILATLDREIIWGAGRACISVDIK